MQSRLEKYVDTKEIMAKNSRVKKNEYIYDNMDTNNDLSYISKIPSFDMSELKTVTKKREDYQKGRDYLNEDVKQAKDLSLFFNDEKKKYDINEVLEDARKNKEEKTERRLLKNTNYNILANLDNIQESSKSIHLENDLEELINTITRKSFKEEKELLADIMATKIEDNVLNTEIAKQILTPELVKEDKKEESEIDKSFYTKSMDLSEFDFDIERPKSKKKIVLTTVLIISIIAITATLLYFLLFKS